ncbi:MAG: hypothetical protein KDC98_05890 [Planctomycetes bacterium]|nr:hypothetical protein [Planctomycetota bacterium]
MWFDGAAGAVMLHGGRTPTTVVGDQWSWDGGAWTLLTPSVPLPARRNHEVVFDPGRNVAVAFGGQTLAGPTIVNQTYEYDGVAGTWTQTSPVASPPARWNFGMAYDAATSRVIAADGESSGATTLNDTWAYDGATWTQLLSGNGRQTAAMTTAGIHGVLLHGGRFTIGTTVLFQQDLRRWDPEYSLWWSHDNQVPTTDTGGAFDPVAGRTVIRHRVYTYLWDGATYSVGAASPPYCVGPLCRDPLRQELVTQSWPVAGTHVWASGAWSDVTPSGQPPARFGHAMAFDATRGTIILWGGQLAGTVRDDATWEWNGVGWTQLAPATVPVARFNHGLAADATGRLIGFGGNTATGLSGETWAWDNGDWTLLSPAHGPTARERAGMVYDADRRLLVLQGGQPYDSETWEWDGYDWIQRLPVTAGPPLALAFVHDPVAHRVVSHAGQTMAYATDHLATATSFGVGCAGGVGVPTLAPEPASLPWTNDTFDLVVADLHPAFSIPIGVVSLSNTLLAGVFPLPLDLSPFGFTGCTAYVGNDIIQFLANLGGVATWPVVMPASSAFAGLPLYFQALVLDASVPGGLAATAAMRGVVGLR